MSVRSEDAERPQKYEAEDLVVDSNHHMDDDRIEDKRKDINSDASHLHHGLILQVVRMLHCPGWSFTLNSL